MDLIVQFDLYGPRYERPLNMVWHRGGFAKGVSIEENKPFAMRRSKGSEVMGHSRRFGDVRLMSAKPQILAGRWLLVKQASR